MRHGRAITVMPLARLLTPREAVDLLGISRRTFARLLEDGEIPFEQPGRYRRVRLTDVLDYQARRHVERGKLLDEFVRESEELRLYDDEFGERRALPDASSSSSRRT
jgi:excisionase family DNA binding protein